MTWTARCHNIKLATGYNTFQPKKSGDIILFFFFFCQIRELGEQISILGSPNLYDRLQHFEFFLNYFPLLPEQSFKSV